MTINQFSFILNFFISLPDFLIIFINTLQNTLNSNVGIISVMDKTKRFLIFLYNSLKFEYTLYLHLGYYFSNLKSLAS